MSACSSLLPGSQCRSVRQRRFCLFRIQVKCKLRRMADTWIEAVARIQFQIVIAERRFGVVQMADVVFGWVFSAPAIEQLPHLVLDNHTVVALLDDVVL